MAKLFNKILCPIDFDDNSMAALDLCCTIAALNGSSVYLMHVVSIPLQAQLTPLPLESSAVREQEARTKLEQVARDRIPGEVRYEIVTGSGSIAQAILHAEVGYGVELIVMAAHGHGRSAVGHFLLGGIAEQVLRESKCPVLAVPLRQ
ncbi:MAG TPA: universal stress protein [Candidatus Binataceae bacterium]|nr:universal stress protein [Candidatus Binataceae bacterium]